MKLARYILLIALTALMIVGILWARDKSRDEVCNEIMVEVLNDDTTHFVTQAGVIEELERHHIIVKGKPVWQINVQDIEQKLAESQYIESVQCLFENGGRMKIKVAQIVPVMRVFDGDQSYYVNKDGKRMTAVSSFFANVPIVDGHFTKKYSPLRLLPMINYVENDSSLRALVTMYCVHDTNNIYIVPSIHGHVVNMGDCNNFEAKFRKLRLFYEKVMPVKGWMHYDTVSVKWDHQVVATKRDKAVEKVKEYDPNEDEIADNASTMQVSDNSRAPVNKMTRENRNLDAPKPAEKKAAGTGGNNQQAKSPEARPQATKPAANGVKKTN